MPGINNFELLGYQFNVTVFIFAEVLKYICINVLTSLEMALYMREDLLHCKYPCEQYEPGKDLVFCYGGLISNCIMKQL